MRAVDSTVRALPSKLNSQSAKAMETTFVAGHGLRRIDASERFSARLINL
jgi:hypothetical protein